MMNLLGNGTVQGLYVKLCNCVTFQFYPVNIRQLLSTNIATAMPHVQELTWHLPRSILKRKVIFQPKCAICLCLFTRIGDEAVAGFSPIMYRGKPSIT